MKRLAYSFLLVALLSCGSSPSSSNYRIKIEFRDSVINDYYLLAVRDSSLVITPYTTDYGSMDSLNAAAQVVPFTKIGRLYKTSSASGEDELWFGAAGFATGGCMNCAERQFSHGNPKFDFGLLAGTMAGGVLLGLLINNSYQELYLDTKAHLEKVKMHACYEEGEPPELRRLR